MNSKVAEHNKADMHNKNAGHRDACLLKDGGILSDDAHATGTQTKKLCMYFIKGNCKYGSKCLDIHSSEMKELRAKNLKQNARAKEKGTPKAKTSAQTQSVVQSLNSVNNTMADDSKMGTTKQTDAVAPTITPGQKHTPTDASSSLPITTTDEGSRFPSLTKNPDSPDESKPGLETEIHRNGTCNFMKPTTSKPKKQDSGQNSTKQQAKNPRQVHKQERGPKQPPTVGSHNHRPRKLCEFFLKGKCKFGDHCLKAHDQKLRQEFLTGSNHPAAGVVLTNSSNDSKAKHMHIAVESPEKTVGSNSGNKVHKKPTRISNKEASLQQPDIISATQKHRRNDQWKQKTSERAEQATKGAKSSSSHAFNQMDEKPAENDGSKTSQMPPQDEHSWMVDDMNNWEGGLTKRVNAKFTQSTKNFPALPSQTANSNSSAGSSVSPYQASTTSSNNKAENTTECKNNTTRSSKDAIAKIEDFTQSWKATAMRKACAWDKPIKIPFELQEKPRQVKIAHKPNEPWDLDEMVRWAYDNLPTPTRHAFLRDYHNNPKKALRKLDKPKNTEAQFAQFSDLPPELRIQIWKMYLSQITKGETVRLRVHYEEEYSRHPMPSFYARSGQSPLLRVNRESREIALKHYEKVFASNTRAASTYFDFRKDKLFLHTHGGNELGIFVNHMNRDDRDRVRCVIIPLKDWVKTEDEHKFCSWIAKFRRCTSLVFVTGTGKTEAPYRDDPHFNDKLMRRLKPQWIKRHGCHRPLPVFKFQVVEALVAKSLHIDTFNW